MCAFCFCDPAPSCTYYHFNVSSAPTFNDQNAARENSDFLFKDKTKPDRPAAVTTREAGPSQLSQHWELGASASRDRSRPVAEFTFVFQGRS